MNIQQYAQEAIKSHLNNAPGVERTGNGSFEKTTVTIKTGYGSIVVELRPNTQYNDSFYRVFTRGEKYEGRLNGTSRLGEYGYKAGKPKKA